MNTDDELLLTLYMSQRKLAKLSDEKKEQLRRVMATFPVQRHFPVASPGSGAIAVSGAQRARLQLERHRGRANSWEEVHEYASPIPQASEFLTGVPHKSTNNKLDKLVEVVHALHTTKMHYYTQLKEQFEKQAQLPAPGGAQPASGADKRWKFDEAYPNLMPPSEGLEPLTPESWREYQANYNIKDHAEYVKHILAKHDGEARFVGEATWVPFPASGGINPTNARFWHYQFATVESTRKYLHDRRQEDWAHDDLDDWELNWILDQECNESTLMRYEPASGGRGTWYILEGNYITLAELLRLGCKTVSCHDLYRTYISLPIFIYKRFHNVSHSSRATMTRNAKNLRHAEEGRWGLRRR